MTAKIDGTNGILQQYDYQVSTTGFSYTFAAGTTVLVMNPAGTLATGTITMPAAPADGMTISFSSTRTITALTVNANTGQSIVGAPTVLPANQAGGYVYRLSNTTWYPFESVPTNVPVAPAGGSIITSGTSLAYNWNGLTTNTSIDFTGIPAWVKRVTVTFVGVSKNGTSNTLIQIGAGSVVSTGYSSASSVVGLSTAASASSTAGFILRSNQATAVLSGAVSLILSTGNTWIASGLVVDPSIPGSYTTGGYLALGGSLDRVCITAVNGTDTFDAGSINILYE
jgi:hypothetical protein